MSKICYQCLRAGLKVGIVASVFNLVWFLAADTIFLIYIPSIKWYHVFIMTVLPLLLGSVVYYLLYSGTPRYYRIVYQLGCGVLFLVSMLGPFSPMLPDGSPTTHLFQVLTIPMHIVAGIAATFVFPAWANLPIPAGALQHTRDPRHVENS